MDIPETYIKMCDCPEIQRQWNPQLGDIVFSRNKVKVVLGLTPHYLNDIIGFWQAIWLPRQDQLQEMVFPEDPFWRHIDEFHDFAFQRQTLGVMPHYCAIKEADEQERYVMQFKSMEQLWLAFVMHELHGKKWDGEKWVKE